MQMMSRTFARRGMSLIDVVVGVALLSVLLLALMGVLRASLLVSSLAKAKAGATATAQVQMEYLRSLTYANLGTEGGIPSGIVPEYATTTEDGFTYVTHTFIEYVDDPADGTGVNDTNGITTDYKRALVSVSYEAGGSPRSVALVSEFAPPGIESNNGGGTLAVNVVNASGAAVPGASVHIVNAAVSPAVDVTATTNTAGVVFLPGAATSTAYQVSVSKSGYSSAQTYAVDSTNQNPSPGYLTVVANQTTTQTFAIDLLNAFSLATYAPIATSTFADAFADTSKIAVSASTTVTNGSLTVVPGDTSGYARAVATTSSRLASWGQAMATTSVPTGATALIHIYDASGNLLPDTVLPGNAAGFSSFPIPLETVSTTTYPSLAVGATFTSGGTTEPSVSGWSLSYTEGPTPLPAVAFTLTGAKIIGTKSDGTPIPKTIISSATDATGVYSSNLEWDTYALSIPSYDLVDACTAPPYALSPGASERERVTVVPATANSLRVLVLDNTGAPVGQASVTLSRTGFSETVASSACGSAYFGSLANASDYSLTVAKSGYTTVTVSGLTISGATTYDANFP